MPDAIRLERDDDIVILRIDRPPANAMELGLLDEFNETLEGLAADVDFSALVVTGGGECFCAGLDLKLIPGYDAAQQRQLVAALDRLFARLYGLPCPTVAAVNGHALAGGLLLALACDVRLGTSRACKLGLPEVRVGVPYPAAAMRLAQAELSPAVVRQLVLSGDSFAPQEAIQLGVLDELVASEDLLTGALDAARMRADFAPSVYASTKRLLRSTALKDMEKIIAHEN